MFKLDVYSWTDIKDKACVNVNDMDLFVINEKRVNKLIKSLCALQKDDIPII